MITEEIELHDALNPKLWDGDILKEDVKFKLIDIVNKYIEESEILTQEDVIDVEIVGSNASYNYTADSDLDLHLVVNMQDVTCDPALMQLACNSEKSLFNKRYDLSIHGIPVEIYVEDVNASTVSSGVYSLYKDEWIKYPDKIYIPDYENDVEYQDLLGSWISKAEDIQLTSNSNEIQQYINNLYNLRRTSIMKDGEYSIGNLVFKEIRNRGILDKLKERQYELSSKELSLESVRMKKYRVNYFLNEEFHYSLMEGTDEIEASEKVFDYFNNDNSYEFIAVEPVEDKTELIEPGTDSGMASIINSLIIDEYEAIEGYNNASVTAQGLGLIDAAKLLSDLSKEEIEHVGELQELMKSFDSNIEAIKSGEQEAAEKLDEEDTNVIGD